MHKGKCFRLLGFCVVGVSAWGLLPALGFRKLVLLGRCSPRCEGFASNGFKSDGLSAAESQINMRYLLPSYFSEA